jgi:tetratricopeptide (TPR) repeat protein
VTRAALDDERSFLLASLEDLERERAAGDLSEKDYTVLRDRYTRRAAVVLRALDHDESSPSAMGRSGGPDDDGAENAGGAEVVPGSPRPARAKRRRSLAIIGSLALLGAVAMVVLEQTGARLPGQTVTGSVSLSQGALIRRTLAQAETLESTGDPSEALRLYDQVLALDPTQVEALSESGLLEFEAGVQARDPSVLAHAQQLEHRALRADPGAYAPHLYLGSMLLAEGDASGAVGQYRQFLSDGPPSERVAAAQLLISKAFKATGQPVPAMPGATTDTTGPKAESAG